MTEAFMEAIGALNELSMSLSDMEGDEANTIAMLICDLGTFLTSEEVPAEMTSIWQAVSRRLRLQ